MGESILQASVPELIDRPDRAENVALSGIFEEPHEANRGSATDG